MIDGFLFSAVKKRLDRPARQDSQERVSKGATINVLLPLQLEISNGP
jgi:hypothetical protein